MKSITTTLFFSLLIMHVTAKEFEYPNIKTSSNSLLEFAPNNWNVITSSKGDLNNDKHLDIAFVLEYSDTITFTESRKDGEGNTYNDEIYGSPRILVIAIFNPSNGQYEKTIQSNTFIPCGGVYSGQLPDGFGELAIRNQIVEIEFHSMSGIYCINKFRFKLQNNEFSLIGFDQNSTWRGSGDYQNDSYNLSTNKVKFTNGNLESKKQQVSWGVINSVGKFTFATITDPWSSINVEDTKDGVRMSIND